MEMEAYSSTEDPTQENNKDYDEWHRRKQAELRSKRKLAAKSEEQLAKERKRKEHVQRTLAAHQAGKRVSAVGKGGADDAASTSLYSAFQALFAKRAEGFVVDLKFRSAPPRPPVGPTFVGKGLAAELSTKWAEYRPGNAIEQSHTWKLHNEPDLGVSLGMFAMDWNGCYKVPKRARLLQNQAKANKKGGLGSNDLMNAVTDEEDEGALPSANRDGLNLHPHDAQLLNWTGSMGDTAAEELKVRRERARAMAFLGPQVKDAGSSKKSQSAIKLKEEGKQKFSRVLDEDIQSWMKKTTYLTNDPYRSVHRFKSLADTKKESAEAVEKKIEELAKARLDPSSIDESFESAKTGTILKHPSNKDVAMVCDYPLLPDISTWGHNFTHVIMDSAPKPLNENTPPPDEVQLSHSYIVDVIKTENSGMTSKFLVPTGTEEEYFVAQEYGLDVQPTKEEGQRQVAFLISIDENSGIASYHPILSRVKLSSGRPLSGHMTIKRHPFENEDLVEFEKSTAEVDLDLADKLHDI